MKKYYLFIVSIIVSANLWGMERRTGSNQTPSRMLSFEPIDESELPSHSEKQRKISERHQQVNPTLSHSIATLESKKNNTEASIEGLEEDIANIQEDYKRKYNKILYKAAGKEPLEEPFKSQLTPTQQMTAMPAIQKLRDKTMEDLNWLRDEQKKQERWLKDVSQQLKKQKAKSSREPKYYLE